MSLADVESAVSSGSISDLKLILENHTVQLRCVIMTKALKHRNYQVLQYISGTFELKVLRATRAHVTDPWQIRNLIKSLI
jgi:hypothetical protein